MKDMSKEELEIILNNVINHFAIAAYDIMNVYAPNIKKYPILVENPDGSWSKGDSDVVRVMFNIFMIGEMLYPIMQDEFKDKKHYRRAVQWADHAYRKYRGLPKNGNLPAFCEYNEVGINKLFA